MTSSKKIFNSRAFVFLAGGLMGGLFFTAYFGLSTLNIAYTDWCMPWGDLMEHYLAWTFFLRSSWHFPIGLIDNIVHPFRESVLYADVITYWAVIFKLLAPLLPAKFQYFGWFSLLSYMLQGAVSALIIKELTKDTLYALIGSGFFISAIILFLRNLFTIALLAQYLILLAIYICVSKDRRPKSLKQNIRVWGGLFCLAGLTHMYFVPMVGVFMLAYLLDDYWQDHNWRRPLLTLAIIFSLLFCCLGLVGAFTSGAAVSVPQEYLYLNGANLNTLTNPRSIIEMSTLLKNRPKYQANFEGDAYLGAGMLLLCCLAAALALKNTALRTVRANKLYWRRALLGGITLLVFFGLALSPQVKLGDGIMLVYRLPRLVEMLWGCFRATGRFIWPVYYMLMTAAIWAAYRGLGRSAASVVLLLLLLLQYQDFRGFFEGISVSGRRMRFLENAGHFSPRWGELAGTYKHIFFFPGGINTGDPSSKMPFIPVLQAAGHFNFNLNDYPLPRKNETKIDAFKAAERARLEQNEIRDDTVYVFKDAREAAALGKNLDIQEIDGVFVGVKNNKQGNVR